MADELATSNVVLDESQCQKQLSHDEMVKMYGRGYKLLLKTGFSKDSSGSAPIKVLVRKPREGLKDDDSAGRKILGESTDYVKKDVQNFEPYLELFPRIKRFLSSAGGSYKLKALFYKVVRPVFSGANYAVFKLLVSSPDFVLVGDDLVLTKPPQTTRLHPIVCEACMQGYSSLSEWSWHVLRTLDQTPHSKFEHKLLNVTARAPGLTTYICLVCVRGDYPNLNRLVHHCRTMIDPPHDQLGRAIIETFLHPDNGVGLGNLFLDALVNGDKDFPILVSNDDVIPFAPATPIDISSDDDAIDLDDTSAIINLED